MPSQDLNVAFVDREASGVREKFIPWRERLFVFGFPLCVGVVAGAQLYSWLSEDRALSLHGFALLALTSLLFCWESLSAATALLGFVTARHSPAERPVDRLNVAILLPMFDEDAHDAIGRSIRLLRSVSTGHPHRFSLHVLSDSRRETSVTKERTIVQNVFLKHSPLAIHYHHREKNTDFKAGNIRAWIEREAAPYDAMLVLDADSHMSREGVLQITNELASEPSCGLVQSLPAVLPGHTVWQWMQAFASQVYGRVQGRGQARWMGREANYYGHNAIIRTRAFAACAGLPHLAVGTPLSGPIMSHDFVEAALLRRAGWGIVLLPDVPSSFEETPANITGFIKRDTRWCYGNLQHLHVVGTSGLHGLSRLHFLHGAATYVAPLVWFSTLILWNTLEAPRDFELAAASLPALAITLVLLPKILGIADHIRNRNAPIATTAKSALAELALSTLLAPTLMVQRIFILTKILASSGCQWTASSGRAGFLDLIRFHAAEWVTGLVLAALFFWGAMSTWILPVALSLLISPCVSYAVSFAPRPDWFEKP